MERILKSGSLILWEIIKLREFIKGFLKIMFMFVFKIIIRFFLNGILEDLLLICIGKVFRLSVNFLGFFIKNNSKI